MRVRMLYLVSTCQNHVVLTCAATASELTTLWLDRDVHNVIISVIHYRVYILFN